VGFGGELLPNRSGTKQPQAAEQRHIRGTICSTMAGRATWNFTGAGIAALGINLASIAVCSPPALGLFPSVGRMLPQPKPA